jgi:uncharacterized protein
MLPARSVQAILLIDGYNIIGAWPRLQCVRDGISLAEARATLVEDLTNYSAFQGYETQVVFDAQYQANGAVREEVTALVSVHYTDFGQTADTYIERFCALFRNRAKASKHRLIVATSDRAQQQTVIGYGAEWMSAQQLHQELDATVSQIRTQQRMTKPPPRRLLAHSLDPAAQARLSQLRLGQPIQDSKRP